MLIRSQDKNKIFNLDNITEIDIAEMNENYNVVCFDTRSNFHFYIGTYSARKKALEVLDMIQDRYHDIEMSKIPEYDTGWVDFTFQMPLDSEVE